MPAGLQLSWQGVGRLPALQLGGAESRVAPAIAEATFSRGRVGERLEAHVRRGGLVGGRGGEVQELAQRLEGLALDEKIHTGEVQKFSDYTTV